MTDTTKTAFPERMQRQAVETHTRRAKAALAQLIEQATYLQARMDKLDLQDPAPALHLAELAMRIGVHFSALEVLRETREWDEAERNDSDA